MADDTPSPPPPLLLSPLPLAVVPDRLPPSASLSFTPSLHIIAAIIACVFLACAFIHLLLRFLSSSSSRRPSLSSSVSTASLLLRFRPTAGVAVTSGAAAAAAASSDKVKSALIDSLPVFTLSSSLAALPKSSPDCAVCLRPFRPEENLRLLPACRHAFHSGCVEPWIRNTPSCPLCRTLVTLPSPPLLSSPGMPPAGGNDSSRSGRVCVEICSDDRAEDESRRNPSPFAPLASPPCRRASSIGSSLDYMMEEEDEEAPERIPRVTDAISAASGAAPQAEEAGGTPGGGGSRRWLRDYMDRIALSESSSFRRSGRWVQRYEDGGVERHCTDLELEGSARPESTTDAAAAADDDGALAALYRWIVGV